MQSASGGNDVIALLSKMRKRGHIRCCKFIRCRKVTLCHASDAGKACDRQGIWTSSLLSVTAPQIVPAKQAPGTRFARYTTGITLVRTASEASSSRSINILQQSTQGGRIFLGEPIAGRQTTTVQLFFGCSSAATKGVQLQAARMGACRFMKSSR